jgi:hypothetical protein
VIQQIAFPVTPRVRPAIVIKFTSPGKARFTSKSKREVVKRKSQQAARRAKEAKKPPKEEITGNASIPAPMEVPATRSVAPIRRFVRNIKIL